MPSNMVDPTNSGPHTDAADSAFGVVLAGTQSPNPNPSEAAPDPANTPGSSSTPTGAGHDSTASDPTAADTAGSQGSKAPVTQASLADVSGLLAVLAALALTPQANTTPPGATPDSPAIPAPAASSTAPLGTDPANPTPVSPAPPTPPAPLATASAARSGPMSGPVGSSAPLDHTANPSPVPVESPPGDTMSGHPPAATSIAPAGVDPARAGLSDRPRPPLALSISSAGATSSAPTPAAPNPAAAAGADDATAAGATVAPPPAEQLVSVLAPLRSTTNGTYTLRLELKPPELGRVEMRVEMKDGVLSASIHADREGSAQLVRDALSDLRDLLNTGGIQTGDLTVSDGGVGSGSRDARDTQSSAPTTSSEATLPSDDATTVGTIRSSVEPDSTSLLDVRL